MLHASGPAWELHHADALDWLPSLTEASADVVFADPPFSINSKSDGSGKLDPWADWCNASRWYADWLRAARRVLKPTGMIWSCLNWRSMVPFQKAATDVRWPIESMLIWHKAWIGPGGGRGLRPAYEMVALWVMPEAGIRHRGLPDVQTFPWSSYKPTGHPAEKPVDLVKWCLRAAAPDPGVVVDPFCGSGTAGVAAVELGHRFMGCDISGEWCEKAAQRLREIREPVPTPGPQDDAVATFLRQMRAS